MMLVIDPRREMIIDKSTFDEVLGAFAVDLNAATVDVVERTAGGEVHTSRHFPGGIKVISRYPR